MRGLGSGVDALSFPLRDGEVGARARYVSRCDRWDGSTIGGDLDVPIHQP
jgi:hypothetical protein